MTVGCLWDGDPADPGTPFLANGGAASDPRRCYFGMRNGPVARFTNRIRSGIADGRKI